MSYPQSWMMGLVALALVALLTPEAVADKKPVQTIQEWTGSVADETLLKEAPVCVASQKTLDKLWKQWQLADKRPDVDFAKEIVVIATTRGSQLKLVLTLDEKGDLQVNGLATRDLRPGFRYVLATVPRQGVKTVNGKPLPTD